MPLFSVLHVLSCHVGIFYHHNYLGGKILMKTSIKLVVVHDGKLQLHKAELVAVANVHCSMKSKLTLCHHASLISQVLLLKGIY